MATKQHYLIIDTESTIKDTAADVGIVICDRKGVIAKQLAILVNGHYGVHELFYDVKSKDEIWTVKGLERRKANYTAMLENGSRMVASVSAINRWLDQAANTYKDITLLAYNLPFDLRIAANTGIDLNMFSKRLCLWQLFVGHYAKSKDYREFVLKHHLFRPPTPLGNMSYLTNAEVAASFLAGQILADEPHTALEDILGYELPIFQAIAKRKDWRNKATPYNWQNFQVRDNFSV